MIRLRPFRVNHWRQISFGNQQLSKKSMTFVLGDQPSSMVRSTGVWSNVMIDVLGWRRTTRFLPFTRNSPAVREARIDAIIFLRRFLLVTVWADCEAYQSAISAMLIHSRVLLIRASYRAIQARRISTSRARVDFFRSGNRASTCARSRRLCGVSGPRPPDLG